MAVYLYSTYMYSDTGMLFMRLWWVKLTFTPQNCVKMQHKNRKKENYFFFWFLLPKTSSQLWSFNVSKCSRWSMLKTHFVSHSLSIHCVLHKSKLLQQKKFIGSQLAMVCSCVLHVLYNRVHVCIVPSLYLFGDLMTRCGAVF